MFLAFPTFFISTFAIHNTVISQIDKYRKLCLWTGADINANHRLKAAWTAVCKSKENGGTGGNRSQDTK
jgi:hypothetical protein